MSDRILAILEGDTPSKRWLRDHLDYPHDWHCLIWPFSRAQTGYGQLGGDQHLVHRLVCEYRHGPCPTSEHHAAHSCGRGHDGCINPWHLSWKTPSENQFDRFQLDIPQPRAKLTPEQVDEIRALKGRMRIVDIAAKFGVNERNIRLIHEGKTWRLDRPTKRVLSESEVLAIRADTEHTAGELGEKYGVGASTIYRIRRGVAYRYYGEAAE